MDVRKLLFYRDHSRKLSPNWRWVSRMKGPCIGPAHWTETDSLKGTRRTQMPECFWIERTVQFSSAAQSCPTLCDPMNRSTPGLPVHHQLPELTQTHVHWVGDATQPSHPLSSPSPPAPSPSSLNHWDWLNHIGLTHPMSQLFAWGAQSTGVSASVLPMNTQDWSPSGWAGWISLQSKGLSRVFSNTTVQNLQFFGTQLSL